jgi:ATP synthase protein I
MSAPDPEAKLKELDAKLKAFRATQKLAEAGKPVHEDHYGAANMAWRMVIEMVSGLGLGFGIGYGLDAVLGTTPWLMVLMTFFGLAAGINVMLKTAKEIEAEQQGAGASGDDKGASAPDENKGASAPGENKSAEAPDRNNGAKVPEEDLNSARAGADEGTRDGD